MIVNLKSEEVLLETLLVVEISGMVSEGWLDNNDNHQLCRNSKDLSHLWDSKSVKLYYVPQNMVGIFCPSLSRVQCPF